MFQFIFVFIAVLFFYIHIYHHIKTSNDLEVYDIPYTTRSKLDEVCDIRQPTTFRLPSLLTMKTTDDILKEFDSFDITIGKGHDYGSFIPIPFSNAIQILKNNHYDDTSINYISENNTTFMNETNIIKDIQKNDTMIRPTLVSSCQYDMIIGNKQSYMCLRYHKEYRNIFTLHEGSVVVKLIPPACSKYMVTEDDYGLMRFTSPMNCWSIQPEFIRDFRKVKSIDVQLQKGDSLYIPAYWWYSIKFNEYSVVWVCKYQTWMSMIATIPTYVLSFLQRSNIHHDMINKKNVNEER